MDERRGTKGMCMAIPTTLCPRPLLARESTLRWPDGEAILPSRALSLPIGRTPPPFPWDLRPRVPMSISGTKLHFLVQACAMSSYLSQVRVLLPAFTAPQEGETAQLSWRSIQTMKAPITLAAVSSNGAMRADGTKALTEVGSPRGKEWSCTRSRTRRKACGVGTAAVSLFRSRPIRTSW